VSENPAAAAMEAWRATHPHRSDDLDAAFEEFDPDSEPVEEPSTPAAATPSNGSGVLCSQCEQPVNPNYPDVLREVTGWSKLREQGGQNHVRFRRETGRLMCGACASRITHAGTAAQESLL
jgi:hypothetical protein